MATYVTSDAHGHVRALDAALSLAGPGADDEVYVLGDMIDRGPDPLGVIRLVRSLPNARVLMGNHESMMVDALAHEDFLVGQEAMDLWEMNGGVVTLQALNALPEPERIDVIDWACDLLLSCVVAVGEQDYVLVHAGIDPRIASERYDGTRASLNEVLACHAADDLLWIRKEFWGAPTGLVGPDGRGPKVVAGHTPSILLERYADRPCEPLKTSEGLGKMVEVGACFDTGGAFDRMDIDCCAAGGAGVGRVGVLRLDDGARFYAAVREGE